MGTNFYWHERTACRECGRDFEPVHVGKSSWGWCFGLRIHDEDWLESEEVIRDLGDWKERFLCPGSVIRDEYGEEIAADEMLAIITDRPAMPVKDKPPSCYSSWDDFHRFNNSQPGPRGLLRRKLGPWSQSDPRDKYYGTVAHGNDGTYDLVRGEFS